MIARLGAALNRWAQRYVPDPLVLAFGLTTIVAAVGGWRLWIGDAEGPATPGPGTSGPAIAATLARGGIDGFASPEGLAFALQMALILVTGHAIALSPPVQRAIVRIARLPRSARSATALVALAACAAALVHRGLGAIAGAILAREIGRHAPARGMSLHYPLLGAAAYTGMAIWHAGLSGSAPLKVAEGARRTCDEPSGEVEYGDRGG